ncbi:hypothetical protein ACLOJK_010540 [Asimina triloba]
MPDTCLPILSHPPIAIPSLPISAIVLEGFWSSVGRDSCLRDPIRRGTYVENRFTSWEGGELKMSKFTVEIVAKIQRGRLGMD